MKIIAWGVRLLNGGHALIDMADRHLIVGYRWHARQRRKNIYAVAGRYLGNKKTATIYMHRLIIGASAGQLVDHINGHGLDNRRSLNLRVCSNLENQRNQKNIRGVSQYKGVTWDKNHGRWLAQIYIDGKNIFLGRYAIETEAAVAYDCAARKYFNAFASTNFNL